MTKLKILEVIRQGQIGGGESHLLDLIYYLDKSQFEPICLSFSGGEMIERLRQQKITCHVIDSERPFDIKVQRKVKSIIREEGIQIVHAHGSRAASNVLLSVLGNHVPFIYTVHGWSFHNDQGLLVRKMRAMSEKLICHYSNDVICVSQSNAETGAREFGLKSVHVIENGINLDRFNPNSEFVNLRKEFGFSDSDFVVGFVARCTLQKNPIIFLEAIMIAHSQNPKIKGLFIGEGDMDNEVDEYVRTNHMKDYIFRSPFRTDVPEILNSIDVYCLPSLWEGLSIALLEAMAMRKAIIVTPTDGTKELIVNENNGLVVPYNNVNELVCSIHRFYTDRNLFQKCADAARQLVVGRFNAQRVAESVASIYLTYKNN